MAHKLIAAEPRIYKLVILAADSGPLFSISSHDAERPMLTDDDVLKELGRS